MSFLHGKSQELLGDPQATNACLYLLEKAAAPYFHMLQRWLNMGTIMDPFNEFMVFETKNGKAKLRASNQIPSFLCSHSEQILKTGEYLNIMKACGK